MQPILAADSFRLNSGNFQVQSIYTVSSDAAKSADDLVIRQNANDQFYLFRQKESAATL